MSSANTPFEPFDSNDSVSNASAQQTPATVLSCDDVVELIPAYSIGAADPDEAAAINLRLHDCPPATAELVAYTKIAEALLYAAPPKQAPARLAAALRAASSAPRTSTGGADTAPKAAPRKVVSKKMAPFTLVPTPAPKPRRRWSFGPSVAVAVALLLVAFNVTLLVQNQQLRTRQEQLATEVDRQNRALIFLAAEEPQEVILPAAQENSDAQADVLWNNSLGVAVIYVRAFPALPPDMAYQLWLRKGEQRTSAGLFTVDDSGMGLLVFPIEESLDAYDMMGITPEPAGGSPGPTAPAVVRGPV